MVLKEIYQQIVEVGIEKDPRAKEIIDNYLLSQKEQSEKLPEPQKNYFDKDCLWNPFADTRILHGEPASEVYSLHVGIDIDSAEILLASALKERPDLVIAHHPQGKALITFYEVMDLQADIFYQMGVSISEADNLVHERKKEVERRVISANYDKTVDAARLLGMNFMCAHTPGDNCAYSFVKDLFHKKRPHKIKEVMNILLEVPEYQKAAEEKCPPRVIIGSDESRVENIIVDFTGGTEGPKKMYERLSALGVDTVVGMHFSEEHYKCLKDANMNAIVAGHIASDNLGINLLIDELEKNAGAEFEITCCSGFRRFPHK